MHCKRWVAKRLPEAAVDPHSQFCKTVSYLLSDANLYRDEKLQAAVEATAGGWVSVAAELVTHPSMRNAAIRQDMEIDVMALCHELAASTDLEVSHGHVRRAIWSYQPYISPSQDARRRRQLEETHVFFPIMSSDELTPICVPASAPAARLRDVFARFGCCLVVDLLDAKECAILEGLWQADLLRLVDDKQAITPSVSDNLARVQHDGCRTWPESWQKLLGKKGCASQYGMPHGSFAWAARLHPKVRHIFASLFDVHSDELAVGLDVVFWNASDTTEVTSNKQWLHVDQNHRSGLTHLCAQGVLYVWPSTDLRASTTAVWPGSHLATYDRLMQDNHAVQKGRRELNSQSVRINHLHDPYEREELARQAIASTRRVPCPAGSLLLWDSRTIHQGWSGGPRLAQPVCWEPKWRRDEAAYRRKLYMCAAGVPSSHSSSEGRVHGMAQHGPPKHAKGSTNMPPLRPTMPHFVVSGQEAAWHAIQHDLWANDGDPAQSSTKVTDAQCAAIESMLHPVVIAAL